MLEDTPTTKDQKNVAEPSEEARQRQAPGGAAEADAKEGNAGLDEAQWKSEGDWSNSEVSL